MHNDLLYHLLDIPYEGADTYLFVAFVQLADGEEEVLHLTVVDNGEDGVVHFGPGVGAAMGVAVDVAASLNILPEGESPDGEHVEHVFYALVVGLIVYDEYAFHYVRFFVGWRFLGVEGGGVSLPVSSTKNPG